MSKIELDDQILDHPKFVRAVKLGGSDIVFLWLGLRSYCAKLLTDGFIPDDMLDEVRGPKDTRKRSTALQALKDAKLVDECDGGVRLHDYLDWASSRDDVLRWRERARERQAKSRGVSQRDSHSDSHGDIDRDDTSSHEPRVRARVAPTSPSPSPSPSQSTTTTTRSKTDESVASSGAHQLKLHYVEEFQKHRGVKFELPQKQWSRATKAFRELSEAYELEKAKSIISRALSSAFCQRAAPWEILADSARHLGNAPNQAKVEKWGNGAGNGPQPNDPLNRWKPDPSQVIE